MLIKFPQITYGPEGSGGGGGDSGTPSPTPSAPASPAAGTPSSAPSGPATSGTEGTPTPPASPPPPPTPIDNTKGDGLFDFGDMGEVESLDDDNPAPQPPPSPPAPAPVEPAKPQEPPAPTGAEPAAQPKVPQAEPPPAVPPTGQQAASPPPTPTEPAEIAQALLAPENQGPLIEHLAANEFQLSKEDLEALEADAPAHIPKLLARTYLKAQANMHAQIARLVPQMIQKQVETMRRNMENENKFYQRWPDLDRTKHGPIASKYAQLYRAANPKATFEDMVEDLGPIVMQAAKITPKPPTTAVNGSGGRPPQPTPFVPAQGGPAAPPQPIPEDMWAGMGAPPQDDE